MACAGTPAAEKKAMGEPSARASECRSVPRVIRGRLGPVRKTDAGFIVADAARTLHYLPT